MVNSDSDDPDGRGGAGKVSEAQNSGSRNKRGLESDERSPKRQNLEREGQGYKSNGDRRNGNGHSERNWRRGSDRGGNAGHPKAHGFSNAYFAQAADALAYYLPGKDIVHNRILIESNHCSRVIGVQGKKLASMRRSASVPAPQDGSTQNGGDDPGITQRPIIDAWIDKDVHQEYRILHAIGFPDQVAKFVGLLVRTLMDESPDPSTEDSREYDVKLLIPHQAMGKLIGSQRSNFRTVETKSAARLTADHDKLKGSEERIVHILGVADAAHIAAYYLNLTFIEHSSLLRNVKVAPFAPPPKPGPAGSGQRRDRSNENEQSSGDRVDSSRSNPLSLPGLSGSVAPQLLTAYETAKESKKATLRQLVRLPNCKKLSQLVENIQRVTDCEVDTIDTGDANAVTLELDGPPEENTLALYLTHRHLRRYNDP